MSWQSWYPVPHEATSEFLELSSSFLGRGAEEGAEGWRPVRLLDEEELPYREGDPAAGEGVATNARLLAGTPYWLRTGAVPRMDRYLLSTADADDVPALADPLIPDRMTGPGFTQTVAGRKWRHLVQF